MGKTAISFIRKWTIAPVLDVDLPTGKLPYLRSLGYTTMLVKRFNFNFMNVKVRNAGLYDAGIISAIGKISFRDTFNPLFEKNNLANLLNQVYNSDAITGSIVKRDHVFFLALADEKPVGFAELRKNSLNEVILAGRQMQLQKLYVLPAFHNYGVGTALLNEVIACAGEEYPDYVWLHVCSANEKAIRFYERNGFKKMGCYQMDFGVQQFEFSAMALPVTIYEFLYAVFKKMNNSYAAVGGNY